MRGCSFIHAYFAAFAAIFPEVFSISNMDRKSIGNHHKRGASGPDGNQLGIVSSAALDIAADIILIW